MKLAQTTVLISSITKSDSLLTGKYVIIYKCPSLEELQDFHGTEHFLSSGTIFRATEAAGLSETLV
jgi:hypothetical protein